MSRIKNLNILRKIPKAGYLKLQIIWKWWLFKISKNWIIWDRISHRMRPRIWKMIGCKVGDNVSIGYDVYLDVHNASLLSIEDDVWIASRCLLLCHKRDLSNYYQKDRYNDLGYVKSPIRLKRGCVIGMGSIVMPGVTIGEGAIIGAGSVVVKDIPDWTIAIGNPAKVVRNILERKNY